MPDTARGNRPGGFQQLPQVPQPGFQAHIGVYQRPFKCCPVPRLRRSIATALCTSGSASGQFFPFLLQSLRGEARDGVPGTRQKQLPLRALISAPGCAGSPGRSAGSRGGKGGAGARARASGHAQPAACGGARCRAGCMYGREGAAAGKADSTPCAHAPAPAGYKAAAPAPPDKVASCDVTGRSCRCSSQGARRRARDTNGTPGSEELRPAPPRHAYSGRRETHITVSRG